MYGFIHDRDTRSEFIWYTLLVLLAITVVTGAVYAYKKEAADYHQRQEFGRALIKGDWNYFGPKVVTMGNRSYIPIGTSWFLPSQVESGLKSLIQGFQREHPELKVISWGVDWKMGRYPSEFIFEGIWVEHIPK